MGDFVKLSAFLEYMKLKENNWDAIFVIWFDNQMSHFGMIKK